MAKRKSVMLECKKCKVFWVVGFNRINQNKITSCPVCKEISEETIKKAKEEI